jgi:two-component system, NtrC family, sensor kinase
VKIRPKLIALIAGIFLVLGLVQILIEKRIVMPSFAELERAGAHTAMRRIDSALTQIIDRIAISATEWGNWDETYGYVAKPNPQYVAANVTDIGLRQLDINVLMLVTTEGRIIISRDFDLTTGRPLHLDIAARKSLPQDFPWRRQVREGRPVQGLLQTNRGILMLAGEPVLDGYGHGPSRGMMFMGRLLTNAVVADIGAQAQSELMMLPAASSAAPERLEESEGLTRVYRSYSDIYGRPVMQLRLDVPREITLRGRAAVSYASACLMAAAVMVVILLVVVLNRMILQPLALVTRHAVAIGEDRDLSTHLNLERRDEIGVLAGEFDRMMDRVAESRTQLVDQSYHAGFAELAKGVLHNIGNAMTPIGVRLATLGDRLRNAPAEDAAEAATELQQGVTDPERSADLREFLRLACRDLAATLRAAQEDVALMTRQTTAVQTTLAEQMRSTRNEHVIEPVRLTDLVAQALEVVPDSCRARLRIDTDDKLRKTGVVRVARTVLRLVLQNLIINAADAVRDAGKERGTLRFSAEIMRDAEREQLHLLCRDDGMGIAPENLERVFEKGYSTKSPETNHGIGLHWCANVIGALGGRIWAESDGPGCGATLHVLVPLANREPASLAGAA